VILDQLAVPIVLAPLAGGPSTPELAAAVSNAGGLGFLASGYLSAAALDDRIARARALTSAPLGVNVFVPGDPAPAGAVREYAARLATTAAQAGVALGEPRFDDDDWAAKISRLTADPVAVTSFTFGCPDRAVIGNLHAAGSEAWVTVTSPAEARQAAVAGADVLVAQGSEAGGHRGSFADRPADDASAGFGLLSLVQLIRGVTDLPLVAAGGIATGAAIAAVLAAGASAAQLGTAFLRCPEAGTSSVHRAALATDTPTAMTRAFTGRLARGVRNRFMTEHDREAPVAYPDVHHLTAPLRAAGRASSDADLVNLWAGQTHELAGDQPAGQLVAALAADTRTALAAASARASRR
jgi:nitronate monooxygenase